jgi:hypothetical protein
MTLEAVLARLFTDERFLERFLAQPAETAAASGLQEKEAQALACIDREGLQMAAASYAAKRRCRAS